MNKVGRPELGESKKSVSLQVKVTQDEWYDIKHSARMMNITAAEFFRQCAEEKMAEFKGKHRVFIQGTAHFLNRDEIDNLYTELSKLKETI